MESEYFKVKLEESGASFVFTDNTTGFVFVDVIFKSELAGRYIQAQQAKIEKYQQALRDIAELGTYYTGNFGVDIRTGQLSPPNVQMHLHRLEDAQQIAKKALEE